MAPRETENNAYTKFWGDKQRSLWYVMVFSGVVTFSKRGVPLSTNFAKNILPSMKSEYFILLPNNIYNSLQSFAAIPLKTNKL